MTWRYHGACRNPLSDCRNGTVGLSDVTVGLLSEITVGLSDRGSVEVVASRVGRLDARRCALMFGLMPDA